MIFMDDSVNLRTLSTKTSEQMYIMVMLMMRDYNINEDGSLNDELGRVYKYNCEYCSDKKGKRNRDMGYKEYVIHMACHHGGLEVLLSASYDYEVRALAVKLGDVACKLEKL